MSDEARRSGGPGDAFEERLAALREEAAASGRVEGPGVHAAGGPLPAAADGADSVAGYYGLPVVKPPVWTWEVPLYFFVGGLAGMAAVLALAAWVEHHLGIAETALWTAFAGAVVSPILLVLDLGRPRRFLHMLRVVKLRSPMSIGVWTLVVFSFFVTAALAVVLGFHQLAAHASTRVLESLLFALLVPAALAGGVLATYTGVLVGATAIPVWRRHHRLLPLHFGISALGSAAAVVELAGWHAVPLHALGVFAAAVETLVAGRLELGGENRIDRPLRRGRAGRLLRVGGLLAGPIALVLRLTALPGIAAVSFLAGALVLRYGWVAAGRASALDPAAGLVTDAESPSREVPA